MNESPVKPSPLLRAEGLTKTYPDGEVQALRGVSLDVERNEAVAIMGPSGCGKSTLLNLLGGLDRPTEGEIYFRGTPLSQIDRDQYRAREIGFVFQSFYVLGTLSAVENVQVPMFETTLDRRQRVERAEALIEQVGLAHRRNHRPMQLSVGDASESLSPAPWPMNRPSSWPTSLPVISIAGARTRSSNSWTTSVSDKA